MTMLNINNSLKIINEEIRNFLFESYVLEHENLKFAQTINNAQFLNYDSISSDYDVKINQSNVIINWHIGFQLNDFGVENFVIIADSVAGLYRVESYDKHSDELLGITDKAIEDINWKFLIDNTCLNKGGALYITAVMFDFKTNNCTIHFN